LFLYLFHVALNKLGKFSLCFVIVYAEIDGCEVEQGDHWIEKRQGQYMGLYSLQLILLSVLFTSEEGKNVKSATRYCWGDTADPLF
jgi:hypothetical protein